MISYNSISAEFLKLKYAPIIWLFCFSLFSVCAIVFLANYMDVNSVVGMGNSPWPRNLMAGLAIFSIFILIPFCVMFISTGMFVENHAQGWKFLYTTPQSRVSIFFSKLISVLLIIFILLLFMQMLILITLYGLDLIMPEFEFRHYSPDLPDFFINFLHSYIAVLAVIGIQFFMSLRFKGFLIPMSFGVVMFVVGFIVSTINKPLVLCSPYSYAGIVKDYNMFTIDNIGVTHDHWLSNVEMYSIAIFMVCIGLALFLELRRNVT